MKLRGRLLLISLLVLALPVGGWQLARQVEQSLREAQAEALLDSAATTARLIIEHGQDRASAEAYRWPDPDGAVLAVQTVSTQPILDGYPDDWARLEATEHPAPNPSARLHAAAHVSGLYLLFEVSSPRQVYSRPGLNDGDRLLLNFQRADGLSGRVELAPLAPGWIESRGRNASGWPRVQGYWQPGVRGWTVELRLPEATRPESLSWEIVDVDAAGQIDGARRLRGPDPALLLRRDPALAARLETLLPDRARAWLVLPSGWVMAHARRDDLPEPASAEPTWLDTVLFEYLAGDSIAAGPDRQPDSARLQPLTDHEARPAVAWTTRPGLPGVTLTVSQPLRQQGKLIGHLLLERDADRLMLDSNRTILRVLMLTIAAFLGVAVLLLIFAAWLSERIRRLRNAAEAAVSEDGQVRLTLTAPRGSDELADLGRSVSRLLGRLREHQLYLRTLADKLAHELRTPLAMIRSSLDNLEQAEDRTAVTRYSERARAGSERLNRILQAMSQATRIEDSLASEALEALDLRAFLEAYLEARRDSCPSRRFRLNGPSGPVIIQAAPDLLAQLLDKLIDNAVDFSPDQSTIRLTIRSEHDRIVLDLDNEGPPLPPDHATLFEAMVSIRPTRRGGVHLGLGLTIARLIADHHQARLEAIDLPRGVRLRLILPRGQAG